MIDRSKKITARFYANAAGRKPVREWLLELSTKDRVVLGKDIQKVEFGWPIGMPYCRPVGHGLWKSEVIFLEGASRESSTPWSAAR
jgi:hypothetical protein